MNAGNFLAYTGLWVMTGLAHAEPLITPTAIDWLLDCPLSASEQLDPAVLERTQCAIITVPRNYAAPRQGNLRLYLTRVGARQPLSREGVVFTQAGDTPKRNQSGTFAIHLASSWSA